MFADWQPVPPALHPAIELTRRANQLGDFQTIGDVAIAEQLDGGK